MDGKSTDCFSVFVYVFNLITSKIKNFQNFLAKKRETLRLVNKRRERMNSNSRKIMVTLLPSPLPLPLPSAVKLQRSGAAAAAASSIPSASTSGALRDLKKWGVRLCSRSLNLAFTGSLALGFALGGKHSPFLLCSSVSSFFFSASPLYGVESLAILL